MKGTYADRPAHAPMPGVCVCLFGCSCWCCSCGKRVLYTPHAHAHAHAHNAPPSSSCCVAASRPTVPAPQPSRTCNQPHRHGRGVAKLCVQGLLQVAHQQQRGDGGQVVGDVELQQHLRGESVRWINVIACVCVRVCVRACLDGFVCWCVCIACALTSLSVKQQSRHARGV